MRNLFKLAEEIEILILFFITLFIILIVTGFSYLIYRIILARKQSKMIIRNGSFIHQRVLQRIQEVNVISDLGNFDLEVNLSYVHCPSPSYEPCYGGRVNDGFENEEEFINVIKFF
jgi:hypothetical protein